uniref:EOG090X02H3 n=1 Tax=Evadne anonyx TaxID=141404 RepID=A0A9N6ZEV7_9CRUS|nr:EOG090X02H3 [Evadne anonyx]
MPWETISFKEDSGNKVESIQNKIVNYQGNYYGLLKSKLTSNSVANANASYVTTISLSDQVETGSDGGNHHGNLSGKNSRTCSVSSPQASEVISNADTGTISEIEMINTMNSAAFTELADSKDMKKEDVICSLFSVDNNDRTHFSQVPVQMGTADAILTASSTGYITLGQTNCFPASPTSSPNLSITSNDSRLLKAGTDLQLIFFLQVIQKLCLQIFGFYRAGEVESKVFSLQFIPSLMYAYLSGIAQGDKKDVSSIQTFLLAVYNIEACEEPQNPKSHSFRFPNPAQPSLYHEVNNASTSLTEHIRRLDAANRIMVKFGPHPHLHSFNAENRLPALAALLRIYSHYLTMYSKTSLTESCLAFSRIEDGELANRARQTLEGVKQRVEVELVAAPLLVSAALVDTSQLSIKGVSTSPQLVSSAANGSARAMWKSMITNASFRTKKLPDDITVAQVAEGDTAGGAQATASTGAAAGIPQLVAISEEHDEPTVGVKVKEATSFRLPEFSSLVKKKSKQPKAVKTRSNNGSIPSNDGITIGSSLL